jgi:hypothetical protein
MSYRAQLDYNADRYGLQLEHLFVDRHFNPDIGFLRREAFRRNSVFVRFSPRPESIESVRKFTWDAAFDYITDPDGRLESRLAQSAFRTELENGDMFGVEASLNHEFLAEPFEVADGVEIPMGRYSFPEVRFSYNFGPQRPVSGNLNVERGRFYNGTRTGISTGRGRIEVTPQISIEPGITLNWIDLPAGDFTTTLVTTRANYTLTPRMATSALVQYNSSTHSFSTNIRFRWEYIIGSDHFIVYTDNRDTFGDGFATLQNRALVVKMTRLFRM